MIKIFFDRLSDAEASVHAFDDEIRKTNSAIHFAGQYYASRSVHADFMKAWNKGKFRKMHRKELERYDEAVAYFKENADGNIPNMKSLKEYKEQILSRKEKRMDEIRDLRRTQKNLQTVISNVDSILKPDDSRALKKHRNISHSRSGPSL